MQVVIKAFCFFVAGLLSTPFGSFSTPSRVPIYLTSFPALALAGFWIYRLVKMIFGMAIHPAANHRHLQM